MNTDSNEYEREYHKMGRPSLYGFLLWIPIMGAVGYCTAKWFRVSWPFFSVGFLYVGVLLVFSIRCMIARYRWKGSTDGSSPGGAT
jgi:membrane protein DedA with SNARE-associated domain